MLSEIDMFCHRCGNGYTNCALFCSHCGIRLNESILAFQPLQTNDNGEEAIIMHYFEAGFNYDTVVMFLEKFHNIFISVRTLKRRLKEYGVNRRKNTPNRVVRNIIKQELEGGPSSLLGYRNWWHKLKKSYHLNISRDKVMQILKEIDPEATEERRARRLQRRSYNSRGI